MKFALLTLAVIALPIAGYTLTYLSTFYAHMSETTVFTHIVFTLMVIAIGLMVPVGMLKIGSHAAHTINPKERILHLSDIPKDKEQLRKS